MFYPESWTSGATCIVIGGDVFARPGHRTDYRAEALGGWRARLGELSRRHSRCIATDGSAARRADSRGGGVGRPGGGGGLRLGRAAASAVGALAGGAGVRAPAGVRRYRDERRNGARG